MSKKGAHKFGTRTAGSINMAALREAMASPGIDQRCWCSRGTVGWADEEGEEHFNDPHSVWIGPEGVECDVLLQPLGIQITALWAGGMAGDVDDISPIHPGDQVLVECPDGNLMAPVITHILHSRSQKQPMTAGVPIFDNKRRLINVRKGDLDVRVLKGSHITAVAEGDHTTTVAEGDSTVAVAKGKAVIGTTGASVQVNQGDVQLGDDQAAEALVYGTSYKMMLDLFLGKMATALATLDPAVTAMCSDGGILLKAFYLTDIPAFIAASYLSPKVKTS